MEVRAARKLTTAPASLDRLLCEPDVLFPPPPQPGPTAGRGEAGDTGSAGGPEKGTSCATEVVAEACSPCRGPGSSPGPIEGIEARETRAESEKDAGSMAHTAPSFPSRISQKPDWVPGSENPADIFTKALEAEAHNRNVRAIGVFPSRKG